MGKAKIKNFDSLCPGFRQFFIGRLPIDKNGVFTKKINKKQAKELEKEASNWSTIKLEIVFS
jgi:hypothetical protein